MNWDAIAAMGQVLGSIAVFVTLWYLAIQTRHAKREIRRSSTQNRAKNWIDINMALATNDRLAAIHVKANTALGLASAPRYATALLEQASLEPDEVMALIWEQSAMWINRAQAIADIDELHPADRVQFDRGTRESYGEPLARLWYETSKTNLNPDAVRYIDNLLAQPG